MPINWDDPNSGIRLLLNLVYQKNRSEVDSIVGGPHVIIFARNGRNSVEILSVVDIWNWWIEVIESCAIECDRPVDGCINFPHIDAIVVAQGNSWKWNVGHGMMCIIGYGCQIIGVVAKRYDAREEDYAKCTQNN